MLRTAVVIDYQNVHLTAHEQFCPAGVAKHESLIHPLYFANQVLLARKAARELKGLDSPATSSTSTSLARVAVFRGLPGNKQQPDFYRRNLMQRSEWTRDRRVMVEYRSLKYTYDAYGDWTAQEKGIDVRVALEVVRSVESGDYDLVILAAHDTDLEPAIEYALDSAPVQSGKVQVETAGWKNCKQLRIPGRHTWHTVLDGTHFVRSRDRKDYR